MRGWPRGALALLVLLAVVATAACQRTPTLPPRAAEPAVSVAERRADAQRLLRGGDHVGALVAVRAALEAEPEDVGLRYLLGVALAGLDRRDEAAAAFRWVVARGASDREEVVLARQWLADATPAPTDPAGEPGLVTAPTSPPDLLGRLEGQTQWRRLEPGRPAPRLKLLLVGDEQATRGRRYAARTVLNEPYQFTGVEPGTYQLIVQAGMVRLWKLPVTVRSGGVTRLDLTEAAAAAPASALLAPAS